MPINRQRMYFQLRMAIIKAVLPANKPESMTDSPYEGRKKGKNIITKMPNPNPADPLDKAGNDGEEEDEGASEHDILIINIVSS